MNNYKVITNTSSGTLSIPRIAPDPDGIGTLTLYMTPGQTVDLSALYERETTQVCAALEAAVAAGNLSVGSTYDGATEDAQLTAIGTGDFTFTGIKTFAPVDRPAGAYAYLMQLSGNQLTGGAAQKTYGFGVLLNRPVGSAATGDSNDALIRASMNNYAANDTNFIARGINVSLANRSGGTLGQLDNNLGCQGKSGGTVGTITGLTVVPENYGTVSDLFGGVDVLMKNEGAVATTEFGVRVRNENNSLATKVGSAFKVSNTGANTGFTTGLDLNGSTLTNEVVFSNGTKLTVSGDTIVFTNAVGDKSVTLTMVP